MGGFIHDYDQPFTAACNAQRGGAGASPDGACRLGGCDRYRNGDGGADRRSPLKQ
jgi:hypothetical protein